jgi:hypothetical protein
MWQQLEEIDRHVQELYPDQYHKETTNDLTTTNTACHNDDDDDDDTPTRSRTWRQNLKLLLQKHNPSNNLELRVLYIPTALYALRKDSTNTPGKQRQRARADGKQRRNELVQLLTNLLGDTVSISAVTLDWDDGSVKQPECTAGGDGGATKQSNRDTAQFPSVRAGLHVKRRRCANKIDSVSLLSFSVWSHLPSDA